MNTLLLGRLTRLTHASPLSLHISVASLSTLPACALHFNVLSLKPTLRIPQLEHLLWDELVGFSVKMAQIELVELKSQRVLNVLASISNLHWTGVPRGATPRGQQGGAVQVDFALTPD